MASMRTFAAVATTAAVLLTGTTHGSAIETNPTSLVEDVVPLTHFHPAYGAAVTDEIAAYEVREAKDDAPIVVVGANLTDAEAAAATAVSSRRRGRSRELEASSRDLQKLEEHFKAKMETNFQTLSTAPFKKAAFATAPWPASYWPIYQDGINAQWDGNQKSPAEKYALGFGLDPKAFMDKVSKTNGILSQKTRRKCTQTSDCDSLKDGSFCGIRRGETHGNCIPGWFGICHAWAPAAILEDEPTCAVTRNNVTFQPVDIKALLTQVYDGAAIQTVFTGARFNGPNDPAKLDEFGRYTDAARRDLGPGFFHIAIANIMGKFKQSFVVDVTAGAEVWNQPVRNYEVVEMKEMDVAEASQQFFQTSKYPFNADAKKLAFVKTNFFWVVESLEDGPLVSTGRVDASTESASYEYLLELDGDSNIIGGEWVNESRYNHPDFLWFPTGKPPASTVTSIGLKYSDVEQLLQDSLKCEQPVTPAPTTPEPTTPTPTTPEPTTPEPTTPTPTTPEPTTPEPTTPTPTTPEPTTPTPTTPEPTTPEPTTAEPKTPEPTTAEPVAPIPTTVVPVTPAPTTAEPTTAPLPTTTTPVTTEPSTTAPTTDAPVTTVPATTVPAPTTPATTVPSTTAPTTETPSTDTPTTTLTPATTAPTTSTPVTITPSTTAPTTVTPSTTAPATDDSDDSEENEPPATVSPQTPAPTLSPVTVAPTQSPITITPTESPVTVTPTESPATTPVPSLPTTTPAQCGQNQVGVDFYGDDIRQVYWGSQSECCDACAQTDGCKAYTFVAQDTWGGSSCYLKSGRGTTRPHSGAISAVLVPSSNGGAPGGNTDGSTPGQVLPMPDTATCAPQRQNLDFRGADLKAIEVDSAGACCDACAATKRCKAYTLVGQVCYLKKGTGKPRFKAGAVSGAVLQRPQQQW